MRNRIFLGSAATLALLSSHLIAEISNCQMNSLEDRISSIEMQLNPCFINPSARYINPCDWGVYVTIDPLLLKAQENGLEFTAKAGQIFFDAGGTFFAESVLTGRTRMKSPNFNWDWGFRLGLGLNMAHDGWDLYLNWTRFYTDSHRNVRPAINEFLLPIFLGSDGFTGGVAESQPKLASFAKNDWRMHLNELDLQLGRNFFVSKWLAVKPHAGLRSAWVRQKDNALYQIVINPNPGIRYSDATAHMKCNFWGLGLTAGVDTQWGLGCGFSLLANYAASTLYGYFDVLHKETGTFVGGGLNNFFDAHDFYHVVRVVTDFIIGLRYDYVFGDCDFYHLGFQAGWEHHLFFGQNQFLRFVDDSNPGMIATNLGDLSLQGFSAQVRFDF